MYGTFVIPIDVSLGYYAIEVWDKNSNAYVQLNNSFIINDFNDLANLSPNIGSIGDTVLVSISPNVYGYQNLFTNSAGNAEPLRIIHQTDSSIINIPNTVISSWNGISFSSYIIIPNFASLGSYSLQISYNSNWTLLSTNAFNIANYGCMDSIAANFDINATIGDNSCVYLDIYSLSPSSIKRVIVIVFRFLLMV